MTSATTSWSASEERVSDKMCPVCHSHFSKPKLLPCGHLLCRHCLISWLEADSHARCPLCHSPIAEPSELHPDKGVKRIVDSFPTDLAMAAIAECQLLLSKEHACQLCANHYATSLCLTCDDPLCSSCGKIHRRMSMSRNHAIENLVDLTSEKLAVSRPYFCSTHPEEVSRVYCPTHNAAICLLCATTDHRQCPEVTKLEEHLEQTRVSLSELAGTLTKGEAEVDKAIDNLDRHLKDTEKTTQVAMAHIEATCDRLETQVKECRRRLTKLVRGACSEVKQAVNDGKSRLKDRRNRLTTHKLVIARTKEMTNLDGIMRMAASLKVRVKELDCSSNLPDETKIINTVSLVLEPEAVAHVERDISGLGKVLVKPAEILGNKMKKPMMMVLKSKDQIRSEEVKADDKPGSTHTSCSDLVATTAWRKSPIMKRRPMLFTTERSQDRTEDSRNCFTFHSNHGKYIVLTNGNRRAERRREAGWGIVLGAQPMEVQRLYEVRVEDAQGAWGYQFVYLGVITCSPESLVLPKNGWSGRLANCVLLHHSWVMTNGRQTKTMVGIRLCDVREGGRVGLALNRERTLHLYIDDQDQGVVAPNIDDPCYLMVDLNRCWKKISSLPVRWLP